MEGSDHIVDAYRGGVERVHARVGPVAADVDIVDILRAPNDTDVAHKGSRTAVGAAGHTYAERFSCQREALQVGLDLLYQRGECAFGLRQRQPTGWERRAGHRETAGSGCL